MTEWTTNDTVQVQIGDSSENLESPVQASDVQDLAQSHNIKKFKVLDASSGEELDKEEFPYESNLKIREYNENA